MLALADIFPAPKMAAQRLGQVVFEVEYGRTCNRLDKLPASYVRYLENSMRKDLQLGPVPIRVNLRMQSNPYHQRARKVDRAIRDN